MWGGESHYASLINFLSYLSDHAVLQTAAYPFVKATGVSLSKKSLIAVKKKSSRTYPGAVRAAIDIRTGVTEDKAGKRLQC